MATLECKPEHALRRMANLLRAPNFDRAELTRLFVSAQRADREQACKMYIEGIEALIRRKLNPLDEILRAHLALTGRTSKTVADVLAVAENSSRLTRLLRRQACRLLVHECDAQVPLTTLEDIALAGDAGRLAAIDFLVTRRRPTAEQARCATQQVKLLASKSLIIENQRRCDYLKRMLRVSNTVGELGPELSEVIPIEAHASSKARAPALESIVSASDMKKNMLVLRALRPSEMAHWVAVLRRTSTDTNRIHTDKARYATSNVLGNLARHFQSEGVVIEMLALAIDLEAMAAQPSEYVFDKVQRICVVALRHGDAAYPALVRGLALCIKRSDLHSDQVSTKGLDPRLGDVADFLRTLYGLRPLVDAIMSFRDHQVRPKVAQLVLLAMRPLTATACNEMADIDRAGRRRDLERLMKVALQAAWHSKAEILYLHECFIAVSGTCFDEDEALALLNDGTIDLQTRISAATLYIQVAQSAPEAWKRCKSLVSLVGHSDLNQTAHAEKIEFVLQKHAFMDVSKQLNITLSLHDPDVSMPKQGLAAALSAARYHLPPLPAIHVAYQAFQALRRAGDHFDAYCALQTMLVRARELTGDLGVRFRAYRRALQVYMSDELQLPESVVQTTVCEKFGRDELADDGLDDNVEMVFRLTLQKLSAEELIAFEKQMRNIETMLIESPTLNSAADAALSVPALGFLEGHTIHREVLEARISELTSATNKLSQINWIDEYLISQRLAHLRFIAANLLLSPHLTDAREIERTQGKPILAMRTHLSCECSPVDGSDVGLNELPDNVICLSLNFDASDALVVTRREHGQACVTLRLPGERTSHLKIRKRAITYTQALAEIERIINEAGTIEVREDSSSERERFWRSQYALDDQMQKVLVALQQCWIAGFSTVFSAQVGALQVSDELLNGLREAIEAHLPTLKRKPVSLSAAFGACVKDVVVSGSLHQLQDLLFALFDTLVLQGASISVDELDWPELMADVQKQVRKFAAANQADQEASGAERKHIVLICDRKASALPWEMLPVLQRSSVTRALSLSQVAEWAQQQEPRTSDTTEVPLIEKVTVVLNPQGNLPLTQEKFETDFRLRKWQGFYGTTPTRDEFVHAFKSSSSLVYVGHGSGSMLAEPVAIRQLFHTPTCVFLFGCSSAAIKYPLFNKDIVTSYAVAGSRIIMGALWNVKDKDCNRFTAEFLSRVFDDKEPVGAALWEARKACMLPYLTSAAWVLYGLP